MEAKLPISASKNNYLAAARRTQLLRLFEATVEIPPRQLGHFMYIYYWTTLGWYVLFTKGFANLWGNMFWNFFFQTIMTSCKSSRFWAGRLAFGRGLLTGLWRRTTSLCAGRRKIGIDSGGQAFGPRGYHCILLFPRMEAKKRPMEKEMFIGTKPPFFGGSKCQVFGVQEFGQMEILS